MRTVRRCFSNYLCRVPAVFNRTIFSTSIAPTKGAKKTAAKPRKAAAGESSGKVTDKNSEQKAKKATTVEKEKDKIKGEDKGKDEAKQGEVSSKDDTFREFRRVCSNVADVDAYTDKTAIIRKIFTRGAQGGKYFVILITELMICRQSETRAEIYPGIRTTESRWW